jgi:hypothetical protein
VAVMRKAQECSVTRALICETFEAATVSISSKYLGQDHHSLAA